MKNEFKITKDLLMSWAKGYHFNSTRSIIRFIIAFCLFIWCTVWCIEVYYFFGYHIIFMPDYLMVAIFYSFIALLSLYIIFIRPSVYYKRTYKAYSKLYDVPEWMRTIEFTDTEIIVTDHTSVYRYLNNHIKGFKERKDHVIIKLRQGIGIRIYKNAFVEGTWEDCKKLISEKRKKH